MNIATHDGTVIETTKGQVRVQIQQQSACGHCDAKGKCGFAESQDKELFIDTPDWQSFQAGQLVEVQVSEGLGMEAVLLAYILPAVVLIASIFCFTSWLNSEPLAILSTIGVVVAYYLVLYLFRDRLQKKFVFRVLSKE